MISDRAEPWRQASRELGVRIIAPYVLRDATNDVAIECIALVLDFGSRAGTVVLALDSRVAEARAAAERAGMFCSVISDRAYSTFDREGFISTLNDWGWYGAPEAVPHWYTGASWTS